MFRSHNFGRQFFSSLFLSGDSILLTPTIDLIQYPIMASPKSVIAQLLSLMIQDRPFDATLAMSATNSAVKLLTVDCVTDILRSIPRFFFHSIRSIGRQNTTRHRAPLKQRNLTRESYRVRNNVLVLGPAAHRDPERVGLGVNKAMEFFYWVETHMGFVHSEMTCREMACVLARASRLNDLWDFLRDMSRRGLIDGSMRGTGFKKLVDTNTVTFLIKVLGEEGLVNEALALFYRMRKYNCKPDVYAYNTMIYALCRVGSFKKARFLLAQMELPGFWCPPDTYTYTILISSYCKYAMQTGCKKATRRRLWEANHMFRLMLFNGFVPDVVTYNCLIDGCCKTYRIERALELFEDMEKKGCVPNHVTYNSFIRYYSAVNEIGKAVQMLRRMQTTNHGLATTSSYTPIIHALCEVRRVVEARNFLVELVDGGSIPREYTYKLVCNSLRSLGTGDSLDSKFCERVEGGIAYRYKQVKKVKPIMASAS